MEKAGLGANAHSVEAADESLWSRLRLGRLFYVYSLKNAFLEIYVRAVNMA